MKFFSKYIVIFLINVSALLAQTPDTLWTRTFGGANEDGAQYVEKTSDGGYIVAGETRSSESLNDIWLLKMAPDHSFIKEETSAIKSYKLSCNAIEISNQMIIKYEVLKDNGILDLGVYNILGMRVCTIVHGEKKPGRYLETWDMKDYNGKEAPSGIYFLKLQTESKDKLVRKFLIIR